MARARSLKKLERKELSTISAIFSAENYNFVATKSNKDMESNNIMWCVFRGSDILVRKENNGRTPLPLSTEAPKGFTPIGKVMNITPMDDGTPVCAFEVSPQTEGNEQWDFVGLRQSFYVLPHDIYLKAGKARELIYWESHNRYCGTCGHELVMHTDT